MAKQSSVNLDITNNPDGFDISGGTTLRKLSVTGGDVTIAGSGSATVTFPTTSTTIAGLGIVQTFSALQSFSVGISANGATFSGNISAPNIVNSLNGFTGAVQVTGSGAILQTVSGTTTTFGARLSTATVTGVASFDPVFFSVGTTGHIRLAAAYQATGSGSATVPLATTSLTGTASFNPNRFQVSATGNVDLVAAFQVTGQTVVSGGASQLVSTSGNTVTIDNRVATASLTGVASFSGTFFTVSATGSVQLAAAYQATGSGIATVPLATTSLTGTASFNPNRFQVSATGNVDLLAAYQATGDTVITVAGSGIGISTSGKTDTLFNIGVTAFNGLTGNVSLTGDGGAVQGKTNNTITTRLASTSLTGVASFNNVHFTVDTTGHVKLATAYQVTGQTVVSGGASQLVSTSGNTVTIDNRIATSSVTGVASFNATRFTVSAAGAVDLASAFQVTGDTIQAGSFINIGAGKTINNIGVQTLNGLTGAVVSIATTGSNVFTGLNSFNAGLSAIGATFSGDIAVQGGDITTSSATATVFNTTATTLSIGNAATSWTMGATSGTARIRNPTLTLGNTTSTITTNVESGNYISIAPYGFVYLAPSTQSISEGSMTYLSVTDTPSGAGQVQINGGDLYLSNKNDGFVDTPVNIIFEGSTDNANDTTLTVVNPTATRTITLPDASGIVALTNGVVTSFNGATGAVAGVTTGGANIFTALNSFNAGISASNVTTDYLTVPGGSTFGAAVNHTFGLSNRGIQINAGKGNSEILSYGNETLDISAIAGNGLFNLFGAVITIGDDGNNDNTQIIVNDDTQTITHNSTQGHFFNNNVTLGMTAGALAANTTTIYGAKIVNEGVYVNGSLRTANISFANGQVQTLTGVGTGATGMTAIYFTGAPVSGAASVTAIITNGGLMTGAGMTSWGGNIKWPGAVKPVLTSSGVDVVSFVTPDAGTTIYGFVGGLGFS